MHTVGGKIQTGGTWNKIHFIDWGQQSEVFTQPKTATYCSDRHMYNLYMTRVGDMSIPYAFS